MSTYIFIKLDINYDSASTIYTLIVVYDQNQS